LGSEFALAAGPFAGFGARFFDHCLELLQTLSFFVSLALGLRLSLTQGFLMTG
jgi:hypothetical protein